MDALINDDTTRCVNHRCSLRSSCKRYLQCQIDKYNEAKHMSYHRFGDLVETVKCHHYIHIPQYPIAEVAVQ